MLLTKAQREQLLDNGRRQAAVKGTPAEIDFFPVVKLFDPCGALPGFSPKSIHRTKTSHEVSVILAWVSGSSGPSVWPSFPPSAVRSVSASSATSTSRHDA